MISETRGVAEQACRLHAKGLTPYRKRELDAIDTEMYALEEGDKGGLRAVAERRDQFSADYYALAERLVQYHCRMLASVMQSSSKSKSIPPGHVAMFRGLMQQIEDNGGSAVMGFPVEGDDAKEGTQLQFADRTVWGHLQEWLGLIFMKDLKISGRDRRLPDELYRHSFEIYGAHMGGDRVLCARHRQVDVRRAHGRDPLAGRGPFSADASEKAGMNGAPAPAPAPAPALLPPPERATAARARRQQRARQRNGARVRRDAGRHHLGRAHKQRRVLEVRPLARVPASAPAPSARAPAPARAGRSSRAAGTSSRAPLRGRRAAGPRCT